MEKAEDYKEDIVVDKKEVIVKKELENKEIWIKKKQQQKNSPQFEILFWKSIEVNNVDEQQDGINIQKNNVIQTKKVKFRKLQLQ